MKDKYITKQTFFWIMGVAISLGLSVAGYVIGNMNKLTDTFNHNFTSVKEDVSAIKSCINGIQTSIEDIKIDIRELRK